MKLFPYITRWSAILLVVFSFNFAQAQNDPAEMYLNFFLTLQNGEKAEKEGDFATAMAKYRVAQDLLSKIKTGFPDWHPDMVDYRTRYLAGLIDKIKDKAPPAPPEPTPAPLPPTLEPAAGEPAASASAPAPDAAAPPAPEPSVPSSLSEDVTALKSRVSQLEQQLEETKAQLAQAITDKATLQAKLEATEAELAKARSADFDQRVADLLKENNDLKAKLSSAEEEIQALRSKAAGDQATTSLREELATVRNQLERAQRENEALRQTTEDYRKQLEKAQGSLAGPVGADPTLQKENQMLRKIVQRQMDDLARREEAKKLVAEEIQKLNIESEVLQRQISIITSPFTASRPAFMASMFMVSRAIPTSS